MCSRKAACGGRLEEGTKAMALAKGENLLMGAPDTFMGAGIQTARKVIDDRLIGDHRCDMRRIRHGPGHSTPDPDFLYKEAAVNDGHGSV